MTKEVPLINDKNSDKPTKVAGYNLKDLAKAPVTPPEAKITENKKATKNSVVVLMVVAAVLLGLIGPLLILLGAMFVGSLLLIAAAVIVLIAVFLPVK